MIRPFQTLIRHLSASLIGALLMPLLEYPALSNKLTVGKSTWTDETEMSPCNVSN
jgi:hypothetical protein